MATNDEASGYIPNIYHPDVMRSILKQILATGDVIGTAGQGRTVPAVAVDNWSFHELAGFGADRWQAGKKRGTLRRNGLKRRRSYRTRHGEPLTCGTRTS